MPRGVYPRKPKALPAPNGSHAPTPTIEDVETLVPEPAPIRRDDGPAWGKPYEANAADFDTRQSPWEDLYIDAMLRLEKTPASKAIVYPFESDREADRGYKALACRARARLGKGCVICGTRRDPPRIFVRRGPNWSK